MMQVIGRDHIHLSVRMMKLKDIHVNVHHELHTQSPPTDTIVMRDCNGF